MKIKTLTRPETPNYSCIVVTLKDGERHEWHGFVSRNAGHVIIVETPYDSTWTEWDLDDPDFLDTMTKLRERGWHE